MRTGGFLSKRSVRLVLYAAILCTWSLYSYYTHQQKDWAKQALLGGEVAIVNSEGRLSKEEYNFLLDASRRISMVTDLKTTISFFSGPLEANVRLIDEDYPVRGAWSIEHPAFSSIFGKDGQTGMPGVAVNQSFLDKTSLSYGDILHIGLNAYQIRGIVRSLPDTVGQKMLDGPMLMMQMSMHHGSGLYDRAREHVFRYYILSRRMASNVFIDRFHEQFRDSHAKLMRWDQ